MVTLPSIDPVVSVVPALPAGSMVSSAAAAPAPAIALVGTGVGMVDLPTPVRLAPAPPQVSIPVGWLFGW
jgi:hypothetical protein